MSQTMRLGRGQAVTLFAGGITEAGPYMGLQLSGTTDWAVRLTREESLELARLICRRWGVLTLACDEDPRNADGDA